MERFLLFLDCYLSTRPEVHLCKEGQATLCETSAKPLLTTCARFQRDVMKEYVDSRTLLRGKTCITT
jgi:hypothetical protein